MHFFVSRSRISRALLRAGGALTCTFLGLTTVHACTTSGPDGNASLVINAWDDKAPDVLISEWASAGNANFLSGCSSSAVVPIDIRSTMPALAFVRMVVIEGENYPAFEMRGYPRSPLLVFRYITGTGNKVLSMPLDPRIVQRNPGTEITGTSFRWSTARVAAVSRGGEMQSVPTTSVGDVTYMSPDYPSLVKKEAFSVLANVRAKTCTLADTAFSLKDINAVDLPRAGSDAGAQEFQVSMNCNGAFPLTLTLTDANAPGNTSSRLTPTTSADAQGVRVQLLREGAPVVLGQSWSLAQSQNGPQNIAITARYYREAGDFVPGVVQGQATLTLSYR